MSTIKKLVEEIHLIRLALEQIAQRLSYFRTPEEASADWNKFSHDFFQPRPAHTSPTPQSGSVEK